MESGGGGGGLMKTSFTLHELIEARFCAESRQIIPALNLSREILFLKFVHNNFLHYFAPGRQKGMSWS